MTRNRQRGMVTAEIAVGLLCLVVILVGIGFGLGAMNQQVRCSEAAAEIARQVARGDDAAADLARQRVPDGAEVSVFDEGGRVEVTVEAAYRPFDLVPAITTTARSRIGSEPG
ncbi:TadE family type IV pilus minor pilin [Naumannella halotolerans]|uniref:TadE-like protein n=1 Tax=Naumannella halotolerans TaxID=993414 RepID=A0A4R7IYV1_9ACTN|nr:TadE family type IV pilus minor pilin [Naumannella halotolerans]TDT29900.1 hypothetical protein CLV29_2922 [Naumannella halotolerans]